MAVPGPPSCDGDGVQGYVTPRTWDPSNSDKRSKGSTLSRRSLWGRISSILQLLPAPEETSFQMSPSSQATLFSLGGFPGILNETQLYRLCQVWSLTHSSPFQLLFNIPDYLDWPREWAAHQDDFKDIQLPQCKLPEFA